MKPQKTLNITNGDAFNEYFKSKFYEDAIPFREAMMDGDSDFDIFSEKFIQIRASELNISSEKYIENSIVFCALKSSSHNYSHLKLWFGKDTFCQINLLTLLAFLEQIGYSGKVELNYIEDTSYEIIEENIDIKLGFYKKLYNNIVVKKIKTEACGVIQQKAVDLYFDYRSDNGKLADIIKSNQDRDELYLICLLLEKSAEYGLSDMHAKKLIEKYRK